MNAVMLSDDKDGFSEPKGKLNVISEAYSNSSVTVQAKNTGTDTVLHASSRFVLQDDNEGFLMWGFFSGSYHETVIPGTTINLTGMPFYDGLVSQGFSLLSWDYPSEQAKRILSQAVYAASGDEAIRLLHKTWVEIENQKQSGDIEQ